METCESCVFWIPPNEMPVPQREYRLRLGIGVCEASIERADFDRDNVAYNHTCENHEEY